MGLGSLQDVEDGLHRLAGDLDDLGRTVIGLLEAKQRGSFMVEVDAGDLVAGSEAVVAAGRRGGGFRTGGGERLLLGRDQCRPAGFGTALGAQGVEGAQVAVWRTDIGRAPCRESVLLSL